MYCLQMFRRKRFFYIIYTWITLLLLWIIASSHLNIDLTSLVPAFNTPYARDIIAYNSQPNDCALFDTRITPKELFQEYFAILEDSAWIERPILNAISYEQLHALLFGSDAINLYEAWPNHFNKKIDGSYPHTSLTQLLFASILNETDLPIRLVVEVGSFMGKSAINIGLTLRNDRRWSKSILLCIDTWLGGLEHWISNDLRKMMGIEYGRPIVYEQFIANIIANNLTKSVIPFSITSILGARFLLEKKIVPQVIYLDSAHLQGETYVELELYWTLLQPGGLLIGDDWSWRSVRCDVLRFCKSTRVNAIVIGNTWYIKKKKSS